MPTRLTIHDGAYALDGGTTHLSASDENGKEHEVLLIQHAFAAPDAPPESVPGRVYFNGEIVAVRSATEAYLMELLRNASVQVEDQPEPEPRDRISPNAIILGDDIKRVVQGTPEQNLRAMLQGIVDYVLSNDYVNFAAKMDKMRRGAR
jgi:hypothetical protein